LTRFFEDCGLPYRHDGSTRITWVTTILKELNRGKASNPDLPGDDLVKVIRELLDSVLFEKPDCHQGAIEDLNRVLDVKDGLRVQFINGQHILAKVQDFGEVDKLVLHLGVNPPTILCLGNNLA
jgi:hypothetical protein